MEKESHLVIQWDIVEREGGGSRNFVSAARRLNVAYVFKHLLELIMEDHFRIDCTNGTS